jgi:hypothetical protein
VRPSVHPCLVRWQLSTIVARALTPRLFAMVTTLSHHMQWSKASFKIRGGEGCFGSDSLKIEMAR